MAEMLIVNEIFLSLQGEGTRAGRPCVLVRLTGCDVGCRWCDTRHARDEGEEMTIDAIEAAVAQFGCPLVEVTGGEPLMQAGATALLTVLCDAGYEVLLETSGAYDIAPVDPRVVRIVDVKCPSSGAAEAMRWSNLEGLRASDEVKFVLAGRDDYDYARAVLDRHRLAALCTVLMGPVAGHLEAAELAAWICEDRLPVRLNLQLHKILWPDSERGV
ncbi:MAG: radical SAM protein [Planctomycetes bacterium]|nr:radical SAM protein [Planctomycetota bacterium]